MSGFTGYSAAGSYYPGTGTGQSASSAALPHLSTSHPGSGGGASTGGSAAAAQEAKYYLTNAIPPPSISEPGINALDDVLKTSRKFFLISYILTDCLILAVTESKANTNKFA